MNLPPSQANGHNVSDSARAANRKLGRKFLAEDFDWDKEYSDVPPVAEANPGDIVDAEIIGDTGPLFVDEERPKPRDKAKSTPPTADEWLDFFSRIILRTLSRWYISLVFRGIDEDELSERELERLLLTEDERRQIAQPWAEYASKDAFLRKNGRRVVALAGSIESFIVLGGWVARVNRIAAKHRPPKARVVGRHDVSSGQASPNGASQNPNRPPEPGIGYVYNPGTS